MSYDLSELHAINEGAQAEEYKARKAAEKEAAAKEDAKYDNQRHPSTLTMKADSVKDVHARVVGLNKVGKELDTRLDKLHDNKDDAEYEKTKKSIENLGNSMYQASDAASRHVRRHGVKNESVDDCDFDMLMENDWV